MVVQRGVPPSPRMLAVSIALRDWPKTARVLAALALTGFVCCPSTGGGSGPVIVETPTPQPSPTPIAGAARLIAMSVAQGSTLVARPLNTSGQQVQELWATVGVTMSRDVPNARFQIFLKTPQARCLGAGAGLRSVAANAEIVVESLSMSNSGTGPPAVCPLPYTTTDVEILVFDPAGTQLFQAQFPATYHFVAP